MPCAHVEEQYTHAWCRPERFYFTDHCNIRLALQLLFTLSDYPRRSVTKITETNALRIGAIHLRCDASTDRDRSKYAHMGMGIFDPYGNAGSTCCKEQGDPSRIGEMPPSPGLLCVRSHFQWLPSRPSAPTRKLPAAIPKRNQGAIENPCCWLLNENSNRPG